MNINELKIGDKIKFKSSDKGHINTGYIYLIRNLYNGDFYYISEGKNIGGAQMWVVDSKDIICKIETIYQDSLGQCCPYIKEIPIKKEENLVVCAKCGKSPYMNYYYIDNNNHKLICQLCYNEKSAPKSFEFDICVESCKHNLFNDSLDKIDNHLTLIDGKAIRAWGGNFTRFSNLIGPEWIEENKTYTIEIKEKE